MAFELKFYDNLCDMYNQIGGQSSAKKFDGISQFDPRLNDTEAGSPIEIDAIIFPDNTGIAIARYNEGPPWSEVTPDPQWEAYNRYFSFVWDGK